MKKTLHPHGSSTSPQADVSELSPCEMEEACFMKEKRRIFTGENWDLTELIMIYFDFMEI